ncbi:DNA ligase [Marinobacterium lutimaris]|uniref:DNA ligase-1 n=1 Tax=Marinobacterium lutimaris TaxID=568106 RepID=A0A1H6DGZ2_9GAMM|nr:DNA ligase [Marinobacterium lutimaris]SEG83915.1 DNA ligase-1 [Marinobacterium lutimaris]
MNTPLFWSGAALFCLTTPSVIAATQAPAIMSAERLQSSQTIDSPAYFVSEKLDGVRTRWTGTELRTRSGFTIQAPESLKAGLPPVPMDGELWLGRARFSEMSGLIQRADPQDPLWQQVQLQIFDLPAHPGNFSERLDALGQLIGAVDNPQIRLLEQTRGLSREQIDQLLEQTRRSGGEGLMLHHFAAHYVNARTNLLLKYRGYDDAEAEVVGYTRGEGKYEGMTGALIVETTEGLRFRIGSGLSDAQRATPPEIGSLVTYRFNGLTSQGLPRFARFVRIYNSEI